MPKQLLDKRLIEKAMMEFFGLPKRTKSFQLTCSQYQYPTIECEYYPTAGTIDGLLRYSGQFRPHPPIPDNPIPEHALDRLAVMCRMSVREYLQSIR